jgi:hypothetical protein
MPNGQKLVMCCGRKRCPVAHELETGSFLLEDEDQPGVPKLVLDREQAKMLRDWLAERLGR